MSTDPIESANRKARLLWVCLTLLLLGGLAQIFWPGSGTYLIFTVPGAATFLFLCDQMIIQPFRDQLSQIEGKLDEVLEKLDGR